MYSLIAQMYCICEDLRGVNTMQNWATTRNSVVKTGKTADGSERQHPGQGGLEPQPVCSAREKPKLLRKSLLRYTPWGA